MRLILFVGATFRFISDTHTLTTDTNYQHIRIIPTGRTAIFTQRSIDFKNIQDTTKPAQLVGFPVPDIAYISRNAPQMSAYLLCPFPRFALSPLTNGEHDGTSRSTQRLSHLCIALHSLHPVDRSIAIIILQQIDTPRSEIFRIHFFVAVTAAYTATSLIGCIRINSEFETALVQIICHILYSTRELIFINLQMSVSSPFGQLPEVVDVNIGIA